MAFNPTEKEVDEFNLTQQGLYKGLDEHTTNPKKKLVELNRSAPPPVFYKAEDPNVNSVIESYLERAKEGMDKYKVTTERTDIDLLGWLNHLQEELMDATIYLERVKKELKL